MHNQDRLINLLSNHWQSYLPKMYRQFQQENRLQQELEATAEQFAEMLYDLIVNKNMQYHQAWEMVINEMLTGEPEDEQEEPM